MFMYYFVILGTNEMDLQAVNRSLNYITKYELSRELGITKNNNTLEFA